VAHKFPVLVPGVELVVVEEALVLAVVAPFSLGAFPPSSFAFPGASLDVPAASELAFPSLYLPFGAASASRLQPLDQSQLVEHSEDSFLIVVV
jgi:hypothetical protein